MRGLSNRCGLVSLCSYLLLHYSLPQEFILGILKNYLSETFKDPLRIPTLVLQVQSSHQTLSFLHISLPAQNLKKGKNYLQTVIC